MNRRQIGTAYEKVAADYLIARGYRILERNFRSRSGEIDLIAQEGTYLCFVEVKYRRNGDCGSPLEAVNAYKQRKILQAARYYLMLHGLGMDTACRFDVVAVEGDTITLIKNAFGE